MPRKIHIPARPETDSEFLELIAKTIFYMGFRGETVEERWPQIKKAFKGFDIEEVCKLDVSDVIDEEGMISNKWKIDRILQNAEMCADIIEEYGSMKEWAEQTMEEHEESPLLNPSLREECKARFMGIGKTTSRWLTHCITKENPEKEVKYRED